MTPHLRNSNSSGSSNRSVTQVRDRSSLWTTKEASAFLSVSEATLSRWRRTRNGPPWINLNGMPRYRHDDLDAYVREHLQ
jgi:DNA-binding transcriptional regulator YiaG